MEWIKINEKMPPIEEWCLFFDGENTMNSGKFHMDKINKHGDCLCNYKHNYTHWAIPNEPDV